MSIQFPFMLSCARPSNGDINVIIKLLATIENRKQKVMMVLRARAFISDNPRIML
jgi:hypothetical protein